MKTLMLYTPTSTNPCGYLDGEESQSQYVDPRLDLSQDELSALSKMGFRRSGRLVYRPDCPSCQACVSVRVPVAKMELRSSMKRIKKKSKNWVFSVSKPDDSDTFYRLFERYIALKHADGDMYPASRASYDEFLIQGFGNSFFLNAEYQGQLIGVMVFDLMDDGLSAVYCFYEPEFKETTIGTAMILKLSELATALGKDFNYLGYWVKGCQKMDYKTKFSPLEGYINGKWSHIDEKPL